MTRNLLHIIFVFILCTSIPYASFSQSEFQNQEELKKKADEYFKKENYTAAMPLYSQLVSLFPKDPLYNYRYGVSVLFADRRESEKPIKYLELASKSVTTDIAVFYYLGMAYHNNYRFAEAVIQYKLYKEKAGARAAAKFDIDRLIEICTNAGELLSHSINLYVMRRTEVRSNDFFRSYDVEKFGGKILVKPDIFKTPLDRKKEKFGLVFYSKNGKEAYFSSYGKDGKNGRDIYKSIKLSTGGWSVPVNLGTAVNTKYDEDFPFFTNTLTLYFSSKGRNTLGGYDLFSAHIKEDGTWADAVNLNYPVNTPFDDIMFVPDSLGEYACFSSNRMSITGLINVYKVRMDKMPESNEPILIKKAVLYQGSDSLYFQTLKFLKEKAALMVNATEDMFEEPGNTSSDSSLTMNNPDETKDDNNYTIPENITNEDVVNLAEIQAAESVKELKQLENRKNTALTIAQNRSVLAENKYKEAEKIAAGTENITNYDDKQTELIKKNNIIAEADKLNKESAIAKSIANDLTEEIILKQKESNEAALYAKEIKKAVQSKSADSTAALLTRMIEALENTKVDSSYISTNDKIKQFVTGTGKKSEILVAQAKQAQKDVTYAKTEAVAYRKEAENTTDKTLKKEFLIKAKEADSIAVARQSLAENLLQESEKLKSDADSAKAQSLIFAEVLNDIKKTSETETTSKTLAAKKNKNIASKLTVGEKKQKADIIAKSNAILYNIQKEVDALKQQADNTLALADEKNKQSIEKLLQSDKFFADTNNIANVQGKLNIIEKAKSLKSESVNLAQQAVAANSIAENLENACKEKKSELINIGLEVASIKASADSDNVKIANGKLTELQSKQTSKTEAGIVNIKYQSDLRAELNNKEKEFQQASAETKLLQQKVDSISNKAKSLTKQADNEHRKAKKAELYKQSEQAQNTLAEVSEEYSTAKEKSDMLEVVVEGMKMKIKITSTLMAESENYKPADTTGINKPALKSKLAGYTADNIFAENTGANNNNSLSASNTTGQNTSHSNSSSTQTTNTTADTTSATTPPATNISTTAATSVAAEKQAASDFALAAQKLTEANNTTDINKKELLTKEAKTAEEKAQAKQLEALVIHGKENKNLYSVNSAKIDSLRKTINASPKTATAKKTETESAKDFETANKLRNSVTDNMTFAQKKTILDSAKVTEEMAIQKQLTAINLYSETTSVFTDNISDNSDSHQNNSDSLITTTATQEQLAAKAYIVDKTIIAVNSKIITLQTKLLKEKNTADKELIAKEITELQNEVIALNQESDNIRKKTLEINNNEVVNKSPAENSELAKSLEKQADTDFALANQKLSEANVTSDVKKKDLLIKEANTIQENAQAKQLEALEIHAKANKNTYTSNTAKTDSISKANNLNPETATAKNPETESVKDFERAKTLRDSVSENMTYTQKKVIPEQAEKSEDAAIQKQLKAIEINSKTTPVLADNVSHTGTNATQSNTTATNVTNPSVTTANANAANTSITSITATEFKGIVLNHNNAMTAVMDSNKLIPLNPELPQGVIFKVQIAASRRHVAPETFRGIAPVAGESAPNGIIRYMAGLFANYQDALTSRNTIRTMGYTDAFIVAYYNGKRITAGEGLALLKNDNNLSTTYSALNNKVYVTATAPATAIATASTLSNPVANISGMFYSVQVGVYVRPVTPAQLFNITPLYDEQMPNGYYRYISGIYSNMQDAVTAKNAIVVKGVKDAFVVVYNMGRKINYAQAAALAAAKTPLADTTNAATNKVIPSDTNKTKTEVAPLFVDKSGIVFKVQLGAYRNDVPVNIVNQMLDVVVGNGLEHEVNDNGLTVYISGSFKDYKSANDYKTALTAKGMTDAFVVAFQNGKKIAVARAVELLK